MFECQVCHKKFNTLEEYAKHIMEENEKDKEKKKVYAEKERLAKLQDKENQINELYEKLRSLIKDFNSTEGNTKTYLISMYSKQKKEKKEENNDLLDLLMESLGW